MGFSLRNWLEEASAQIRPGDGKTAATVRAARTAPAPAARTVRAPAPAPYNETISVAPSAPSPTPSISVPRFNYTPSVPSAQRVIERPRQSFGNKLRDVLDANTEADQYRRQQGNERAIAEGRPQEVKPIKMTDPGNLIGNTVGAIPRMMNTAAAQVPQFFFSAQDNLAAREYSAAVASGDKARIDAALNRLEDTGRNVETANSMFNTGHGGLFNVGTLYGQKDAEQGGMHGAKNVVAGTAEGMVDVASLGLGGLTAKQILEDGVKTAIKQGGKRVAADVALNTAGGAASAIRNDASGADVARVAGLSGVTGTVMDIGVPYVGAKTIAATRRAIPKIVQYAQRNVDQIPEVQIVTPTVKIDAPTPVSKPLADTQVLPQEIIDVQNEAIRLAKSGDVEQARMYADSLPEQYQPTIVRAITEQQVSKYKRGTAGFHDGEAGSIKKQYLGELDDLRLSKQDNSTLEDVFVGSTSKKISGDSFTVYRVVPKGAGIEPGDFVFDNKKMAQDFLDEYGDARGLSEIKTTKVTKEDLALPFDWQDRTVEGEFIFHPTAKKPAPNLRGEKIVQDYADYLRSMESSFRGGDKVPTADGGYIRTSEHSKFYRDFYAENGRKPTKTDWLDYARRELDNGRGESGMQKAYHDAQDPEIASLFDAGESGVYGKSTIGDTFDVNVSRKQLADIESKIEAMRSRAQIIRDGSGDVTDVKFNDPADAQAFDDLITQGRTAWHKVNSKPLADMPSGGTQVVTKPAGKKSRYANKTVQESDEVSAPLKKMVREEDVRYRGTTDAERLAVADSTLKGMNNDDAFTKVMDDLESAPKNSNGQEAVTAIQLIKRLDEIGDENSLFKATEIFHKLSADASKRGQQIQALSALSARTPQGLLYHAEKTIGKYTKVTPEIREHLKQLIDTVKGQAPGSYEDGLARYKVMEYVSSKAPANIADKGVQIWKAGLLTAPTTTAGNVLANVAEQVYKKGFKDPVSTAADVLFSLFTGRRSRSMTMRGISAGLREGTENGVKYFKSGYDPRDPLTKFDVKNIHYSDTPLGMAAEAYTRSVFRLMGAQDQPFYYASLRNSLADQAITEAKNRGINGASRIAFIRDFVTQPSKQAMELADKEARYDVFQNKTALGNIASGIKDKSGAVGDYLIPFSQVPSSVATRMIDRTPLGLAKEIITQIKAGKFDQRAMTKAVADASAGVLLMGVGSALAQSGNLTLSYPTEKAERDLWELEGKQPNSIKIGNTWVSLNYIQPAGTLIAAGANYRNAVDEGKNKDQAFSAAAAGAGKALTEQSFLKGVSGALNALADPQRSAEKFSENAAGSIVPNIIRSATRSADSVQRNQDGILDSVKAGLPGARQTLSPKVDIFGEEIPRKTDATNSFLNPLRPSDERPTNEVNKELRRLRGSDNSITATGILKNALGSSISLTRDQQYELKIKIGQRLKDEWSSMMSDPRYAEISDKQKKKALEKIRDDITGAYKIEFGIDSGLQPNPDSKNIDSGERDILAGSARDYLAETGAAGGIKAVKGMTPTSLAFIHRYNTLDTVGRKKLMESSNDAQYMYELAKYESDKANGTLTKAQDITAQFALKKAAVGSQFAPETRDIYSLSKAKITALLQNDPNGEAMFQDLYAYGQALEAAGIEKNKLRSGSSSTGTRRTSSGKRTAGRRASKFDFKLFGLADPIKTTKSLRSILADAKITKGRKIA